MIFTKDVNFTYPILRNNSDDYTNAEFNLDIDIEETSDNYTLIVNSIISSEFLKSLIRDNKARLILIIKSKDNLFFNLDTYGTTNLNISKNKLSFCKSSTKIQLMIQSLESLCFESNADLNEFYNEYRNEITIPAGHVLGISSVEIFDGRDEKPFELFEKKLDPKLKSDIAIDVNDDFITLVYKNEELMFTGVNPNLINPYIYIGLERALIKFILRFSNNEDIEDGIELSNLASTDFEKTIDQKLYDLMVQKKIGYLDIDNLDEVIYTMSDNIIKKYSNAVWRLKNENA